MLQHPAARPYEVARACDTLRRYGTPGDRVIAAARYKRLRAELAAVAADPMFATPATSPARAGSRPAGAILAPWCADDIADRADHITARIALTVTSFAAGWILAALLT